MERLQSLLQGIAELTILAYSLVTHAVQFLYLCTKSEATLSAEVLFLHKQLGYYQERQIAARRFDNPSRFLMVLVSRFMNWREDLVVVKPKTLMAWHRAGFRLLWRWSASRS